MPMIICPQCGKEISDKAQKCIYCGYELEKPEKICTECGTKPDENVPNPKNKKKWILPIIVVAIVLVVCLIIVMKNGTKTEDGLYNGIAWGTTYEDLKESLEDAVELEADEGKKYIIQTIENFNGIDNVSGKIVYGFADDGNLDEITIWVGNSEEESGYTNRELYDEYVETYTKTYGECAENLDAMKGFYEIKWETSESAIEMVLTGSDDDILTITYSDIDLAD